MSWMLELLETYDKNSEGIGKPMLDRFGKDYTLLPIGHMYQAAQIEVTLNLAGEFVYGRVIPKEKANTLIPCTIDSSNRTSAPVPHPLHDKLIYVAGDYKDYGGVLRNKTTPNKDYLEQLKEWCEFDSHNHIIQAVYDYVRKGSLIRDLIEQGVLFESNGEVIPKWTREYQSRDIEKPEIFSAVVGEQLTSFVRFNVEKFPSTWQNSSMFQSFIKFNKSKVTDTGLCYITGEKALLTDKHPSKIRYGGDMSKIISGNDESGFTFKGRFDKKEQVATIGYAASQKSHNALKWLITKQGQIIDGRVFLVWGTKSVESLDLMDNLFLQLGVEAVPSKYEEEDSRLHFSKEFRKAIGGYRNNLEYGERISILILDAATPGRMSILYYQTLDAQLYLDRLQKWHETCLWKHAYKRDEDKKMSFFYGAPTNRDIAKMAYGSHASDQIIKVTIERLLPSIVEGRPIPRDIVQLLINRASSPQAMEDWEWEKTLSIACSMVKKLYEKEEIEMALNKESKDRNYLFGRMLAVADVLERNALSKMNEHRPTTAKRYMNAFSKNPMTTWKIIQESIQPYEARLGSLSIFYDKTLNEINSLFEESDYSDKALNGKYLNGFYSQRDDLYTKKEDKKEQTK